MDHGWAAGFECRRHGSDGVGVAVGCAPVAGAVAALVVPLVACHRLLVSFEFFFLLASLVWFPFWLLVSCPLFWLWRLAFLLRVARALRVDFLLLRHDPWATAGVSVVSSGSLAGAALVVHSPPGGFLFRVASGGSFIMYRKRLQLLPLD